ncbi:hypothetical protein [Geomonas edaphica]|uniref:hypothetical protein n=1 Tax=Geomonas edaphica TaxID=2570226 RepID=UPI0010A91556|nr:hypothetical protein [Geomonas edaphica]
MAIVKSRCQKRVDRYGGCKTSSVGAVVPGLGRELYYCCLDETECGYALPVGYDVVCKHPESERFQERPTVRPARRSEASLKKKSRS